MCLEVYFILLEKCNIREKADFHRREIVQDHVKVRMLLKVTVRDQGRVERKGTLLLLFQT